MQGYAVIFTDHGNRRCWKPAKMRTGESRLIRLQKQLERDGIPYTTAFGADERVEVYWGSHPMNVVIASDEAEV